MQAYRSWVSCTPTGPDRWSEWVQELPPKLKIWSNNAELWQYITIKAKFGKEEYTIYVVFHATFDPDRRTGWVLHTEVQNLVIYHRMGILRRRGDYNHYGHTIARHIWTWLVNEGKYIRGFTTMHYIKLRLLTYLEEPKVHNFFKNKVFEQLFALPSSTLTSHSVHRLRCPLNRKSPLAVN